ncbi:NAD-dependent epimerase/dehydratase family protein [Marinomonas mediterranea]|jgi:Nucleoside-diphosphate-sugar epimerases|uniref:NAD-dependent epimerase/dehydratase n=1 Tax=Marinomonas mediterranea (strain ATCC 700492 / JCM 21426 / NBRC 103028 / MMB-1) TaxID=717774 RepID=F2JVA8_MARM1|nr:NAD(P)-dependent oxidoreductase [Marinomonas mediterranea]ADZ89366.1 NAD-dependent epimerase/dehydratase [Marinomonas mediterranea MMB-1]WCN15630.1 NAD-dependent epimerase/dehydratase family protein [Marinomonas mediterranea MMB-1]
MKRILLTGAAGNLGKALRKQLAGWADELRLSDIVTIDDLQEGESFVNCDISDLQAVIELVKDCDGIIHAGGQSIEGTWDNILDRNIKGTYNIYEAARQQGVKRVFFTSSNHLVGFHERETLLDNDSPMRPDSLYGVSKGFGEVLARYYYDKFGIESTLARIGSCFPEIPNRRMLSTWLSERDLADLIKTTFDADRLGCTMVYAVSNNKAVWCDNRHASFIGWQPQDSSEPFADQPHLIEEGKRNDPNDPAIRYQGGAFVTAGHFDDEQE